MIEICKDNCFLSDCEYYNSVNGHCSKEGDCTIEEECEEELKINEYLVCFYDGETDNCFDEMRMSELKSACDYCYSYNKDLEKGDDYTRLYVYVPEIGLVEIGDFKPKFEDISPTGL